MFQTTNQLMMINVSERLTELQRRPSYIGPTTHSTSHFQLPFQIRIEPYNYKHFPDLPSYSFICLPNVPTFPGWWFQPL